MPYAVLMPVFADRILHGGPRALGLLMGASGVGALAAAGLLATREGVRGLGRWVALASAGFGVSLLLFAWSTSLWLSAAALVPVGFCMMLQMASSNTLIQSMVPDALRGRVMAIYSMMFMGMAPFGALLAGTLADRIGAPATVAGGGVVCVVGALVFGAAAAGAPARGAPDHHRAAGRRRGARPGHHGRRGGRRIGPHRPRRSLKAKALTREVSAGRDWRGKQAESGGIIPAQACERYQRCDSICPRWALGWHSPAPDAAAAVTAPSAISNADAVPTRQPR